MDKFQPYSRCKEKYLKKLKRADKEGFAPYSFNNLTTTEKISWALKMAEAVSVLHNFKGGTIVHGDIALRQFLISKTDGSVKLVSAFRGVLLVFVLESQEYARNSTNALRKDQQGLIFIA
jgi:hypothetical protein